MLLDSPSRILKRINFASYFPNIRAITFVRFCAGTRLIQPYHDTNVFLLFAYQVNSVDDLYLWDIINGRRGQVHVSIYPLLGLCGGYGTRTARSIIPFAPLKSVYERRIEISCREAGASEEDAIPVSAAFYTSLAIASYSRGYWILGEAKGNKTKIQKPGERTSLAVDTLSQVKGIESCMGTVSSILMRLCWVTVN